jgi:CrcB protein
MNDILLIFFGSGAGGVFRYWISNVSYWLLGRQFPYGTLVVNATGSFLMGLFFVVILERYSGRKI